MEKTRIAIALLALALVAGCNDLVTPAGVVATAYQAVKTNDLKLLQQTMDGAALEHYGNPVGVDSLRTWIGAKSLKVAEPVLTGVEHVSDGFKVRIRHYLVAALDQHSLQKVLTATVHCDDYVTNPDTDPNDPTATDNEVTECKISDIQ